MNEISGDSRRCQFADHARLPTSIDVAAAAQVSQATVSRALRGDPSISEPTRDRVARVAQRLGYWPDSRAVRLRAGSISTVAVVLLLPDCDKYGPFNPFYHDIACAVAAAAAKRNVNVLLSCQSWPSSLRGDFEKRREADGLIVIGTATNKSAWDFFARLQRDGANLACWGAPDNSMPTIRADNRIAGMLAAQHLISRGRKGLAFIGPGWQTHQAFGERRQGFLGELKRNGLSDYSLGFAGTELHRHGQGEAAMKALLAAAPHLDGVFAASDVLAAGALDHLSSAGRRVPGDIAIVGFDGGSASRHYLPTLTRVEQDVHVAGELLLETVLGRGRAHPDRSRVIVPVRLVVRETTGGN